MKLFRQTACLQTAWTKLSGTIREMKRLHTRFDSKGNGEASISRFKASFDRFGLRIQNPSRIAHMLDGFALFLPS